MRYLIILLLFFGWAFASEEIETEHFSIIFDKEYIEYAQRIAAEAEQALLVLSPIFASPKEKIVIRIYPKTDTFNASASPYPRSTMVFRTVRSASFRSVYTVIIHELTHIKQLAFTEGVDGKAGLLLGLDLGTGFEDISAIPPAWFIEGIATWVESHYAINGRLYSSFTSELIDSLVLGDNWPSLTDLSLANLESWPAGAARYYLGVGFIEYLVEKYSFETIIDLLKNYNSSYYKDSFSQNWQKLTGSSLFSEYADWTAITKENALKRKEKAQLEYQLSQSGWFKSGLAISPDGRRIAYGYIDAELKESYLILADYDGKNLSNRKVLANIKAIDIAWLDNNSLVYNRIFSFLDSDSFLDLFSFDLQTNSEKRLTNKARALFPSSYNGCIYYVQNSVVTGSSIKKLCQNETTTIYETKNQTYLGSLAISPNGQIIFSLVYDNATDIVLLKNGEFEFITDDHFSRQAGWLNQDEILFISNASAGDQLYKYNLLTKELTQLSDSFAGVLKYSNFNEQIVYFSLTGEGYDLFRLEPLAISSTLPKNDLVVADISYKNYPVGQYNPINSLLPFAWYPDVSFANNPLLVGLGANILGEDYSGKHSYLINFGYRFGSATSAGYYSALNYYYKENYTNLIFSLAKEQNTDSQIKFGISQYIPLDKQALYFSASLDSSLAIPDFKLKPQLRLLASFTAVKGSADDKRGFSFALSSYSDIRHELLYSKLSAFANYYYPLKKLDLVGNIALNLNMSTDFEKLYPLNFRLVYNYRLPLKLRYDDGLYGLEYIRISPSIATSYNFNDSSINFSSSIALGAELMLFYNLPISYGIEIPIYNTAYKLSLKTALDLP